MYQRPFTAIGSMSGTSLDGLDLCLATFAMQEKTWTQKIHHSTTIFYTDAWRQKLQLAHKLSGEELQKLDAQFGQFIGQSILHFIKKTAFQQPIDLISNHGHTVFHQPQKKRTLQIGNGPHIRDITGIKTVCDFRLQDVLLNGQGAPLVPIGDELLFPEYQACINLGGFANISLKNGSDRLAFDICPVNIVLNFLTQQLGKPFDDGGKIAQSGQVIPTVLSALNGLSFYQQNPPKSLGREWVEKYVFPLLTTDFKTEDLICTFTEHVALQIAKCVGGMTQNILVTGGGAYNNFLILRLQALCKAKIILPEKQLIEQKEAMIFAFLGVLRNLNLPNCLHSVTGATKNHSSGRIWPV